MSEVLTWLAVILAILVVYGIGWVVFAYVMLTRLARGDFGDPTDLNE